MIYAIAIALALLIAPSRADAFKCHLEIVESHEKAIYAEPDYAALLRQAATVHSDYAKLFDRKFARQRDFMQRVILPRLGVRAMYSAVGKFRDLGLAQNRLEIKATLTSRPLIVEWISAPTSNEVQESVADDGTKTLRIPGHLQWLDNQDNNAELDRLMMQHDLQRYSTTPEIESERESFGGAAVYFKLTQKIKLQRFESNLADPTTSLRSVVMGPPIGKGLLLLEALKTSIKNSPRKIALVVTRRRNALTQLVDELNRHKKSASREVPFTLLHWDQKKPPKKGPKNFSDLLSRAMAEPPGNGPLVVAINWETLLSCWDTLIPEQQDLFRAQLLGLFADNVEELGGAIVAGTNEEVGGFPEYRNFIEHLGEKDPAVILWGQGSTVLSRAVLKVFHNRILSSLLDTTGMSPEQIFIAEIEQAGNLGEIAMLRPTGTRQRIAHITLDEIMGETGPSTNDLRWVYDEPVGDENTRATVYEKFYRFFLTTIKSGRTVFRVSGTGVAEEMASYFQKFANDDKLNLRIEAIFDRKGNDAIMRDFIFPSKKPVHVAFVVHQFDFGGYNTPDVTNLILIGRSIEPDVNFRLYGIVLRPSPNKRYAQVFQVADAAITSPRPGSDDEGTLLGLLGEKFATEAVAPAPSTEKAGNPRVMGTITAPGTSLLSAEEAARLANTQIDHTVPVFRAAIPKFVPQEGIDAAIRVLMEELERDHLAFIAEKFQSSDKNIAQKLAKSWWETHKKRVLWASEYLQEHLGANAISLFAHAYLLDLDELFVTFDQSDSFWRQILTASDNLRKAWLDYLPELEEIQVGFNLELYGRTWDTSVPSHYFAPPKFVDFLSKARFESMQLFPDVEKDIPEDEINSRLTKASENGSWIPSSMEFTELYDKWWDALSFIWIRYTAAAVQRNLIGEFGPSLAADDYRAFVQRRRELNQSLASLAGTLFPNDRIFSAVQKIYARQTVEIRLDSPGWLEALHFYTKGAYLPSMPVFTAGNGDGALLDRNLNANVGGVWATFANLRHSLVALERNLAHYDRPFSKAIGNEQQQKSIILTIKESAPALGDYFELWLDSPFASDPLAIEKTKYRAQASTRFIDSLRKEGITERQIERSFRRELPSTSTLFGLSNPNVRPEVLTENRIKHAEELRAIILSALTNLANRSPLYGLVHTYFQDYFSRTGPEYYYIQFPELIMLGKLHGVVAERIELMPEDVNPWGVDIRGLDDEKSWSALALVNHRRFVDWAYRPHSLEARAILEQSEKSVTALQSLTPWSAAWVSTGVQILIAENLMPEPKRIANLMTIQRNFYANAAVIMFARFAAQLGANHQIIRQLESLVIDRKEDAEAKISEGQSAYSLNGLKIFRGQLEKLIADLKIARKIPANLRSPNFNQGFFQHSVRHARMHTFLFGENYAQIFTEANYLEALETKVQRKLKEVNAEITRRTEKVRAETTTSQTPPSASSDTDASAP